MERDDDGGGDIPGDGKDAKDDGMGSAPPKKSKGKRTETYREMLDTVATMLQSIEPDDDTIELDLPSGDGVETDASPPRNDDDDPIHAFEEMQRLTMQRKLEINEQKASAQRSGQHSGPAFKENLCAAMQAYLNRTSHLLREKTLNETDRAWIQRIEELQQKVVEYAHFQGKDCRVQFIIDDREHALWPFFEPLAKHLPHVCKRKRMKQGDFHFLLGQDTCTVIERKGERDLSGAIQSHSFQDQREALKSELPHVPDNQKIFMFEGEPHLISELDLLTDGKTAEQHHLRPFASVQTAKINIQHIHGMQIMETRHVLHSVFYLCKTLETLMAYPDLSPIYVTPLVPDAASALRSGPSGPGRGPPGPKRATYAVVDKSGTPEALMVNMLDSMRIRVGENKARAIAKEYGNMMDLCLAFAEQDKAVRPRMLAGLEFDKAPPKPSDLKAKQKRQMAAAAAGKTPRARAQTTKAPTIGEALSRKIYDALCGNVTETLGSSASAVARPKTKKPKLAEPPQPLRRPVANSSSSSSSSSAAPVYFSPDWASEFAPSSSSSSSSSDPFRLPQPRADFGAKDFAAYLAHDDQDDEEF